jgi:hypothetical protein
MRLPNAEKAVIERRKLTEYLLSETHPTGRFKAQFFKKTWVQASQCGAI